MSTTPEASPRGTRKVRTTVVLVVLIGALAVAAVVGAGLLWASKPDRDAQSDVTCWDGKEGPEADCTEPTGVAGLRWVYPELTPKSSDCKALRMPRGSDKQESLAFACDVPLAGDEVRIVYTRYPSPEDAQHAASKKHHNMPPEEQDGREIYRDRKPHKGRWHLTSVYLDHPFSVSVEASTAKLRNLALAELVTRSPEEIRVRPGE
ncbi:hypothetical protein [Nocardioides sp. GXZ039]|uniref:hypothetical protein n=1 Tax=Nocardioides sp. GXZ039 TaxID=3136018 RepID=UPI0030F4044F